MGAWVLVFVALADALVLPGQVSSLEPSITPGRADVPAATVSVPSPPTASSPAPASSPVPDPSAEPPSEPTASAQLIAKALEEGRIDYPTSLVYRGYAFWGDDRLPEDLWGAGSTGEDQSLNLEIDALGSDAPVDLRDELASIVARPADPMSIANRQLDGQAIASVAAIIAPQHRYILCPLALGWRTVRVADRAST